MESLYEAGIADTMNREDAPIGSGAEGGPVQTEGAEATGVTKQTTETLMAGERIMEAIDLADEEIATFREYEEAKTKGGLSAQVEPPPRNQVLAAYDLEPEEYVLRVVERVSGAALYDALLVLPFGKVVSLMQYLNHWAQKVRLFLYLFPFSSQQRSGMESGLNVSYHFLPVEDAPPPNRVQPRHAHCPDTSAQTPSTSFACTKGHAQLQSSSTSLYQAAKRS